MNHRTSTTNRSRILKLISYREVTDRILRALSGYNVPIESVPVDTARGRVCAEEIRSARDFPDRDLAAMDGYAIDSLVTRQATISKPLSFDVVEPSNPDSTSLKKGSTIYVATGTPLQKGADAVVRSEEVKLEGSTVKLLRPVAKGKNVFGQGEDYRKGDLLIKKNQILSSADVAILISLGKREVRVFRVPKVGILSIGDGLVVFGTSRKNIQTVNNYSNLISGYLAELGAIVEQIGVCPNDPEAISSIISDSLRTFDLIITIGGSSVGEKDLTIESAVSISDASQVFHGVNIVPIRPAGFLMIRDKPVVVLPANAVSVATSFFVIGLPILNLISGLTFNDRSSEIVARSLAEFENTKPKPALFLVTVKKTKEGKYEFRAYEWSSNLSSDLAKSNGFIKLEKNQKVSSNEEMKVCLFGASELIRINDTTWM